MSKEAKAAATASNVKAAIQSASGHVQFAVANTENAAISAVDRVETFVQSARTGFDSGLESVKAVGSEVVEVVDNAGRTTLGGVVAVNGALMTYGREAITDIVDVSRKTFESKSLQDVVALHTAFAERRLRAMFSTAAAVNELTQKNVMAAWSPFATLLNGAGAKAADTFKTVEKAALKTAA